MKSAIQNRAGIGLLAGAAIGIALLAATMGCQGAYKNSPIKQIE